MKRSAHTCVFIGAIFLLSASLSVAVISDEAATRPSTAGQFHEVTVSPNFVLDRPDWLDQQVFDGLTEDQIKTLQSIRHLRGTTTYVMTYYGSYGTEDTIELPPYDLPERITCSTFSAMTPSGQAIFAYNQDTTDTDWSLIIFAKPPDGYTTMGISASRFCSIRDYTNYPHYIPLRDRILTAPHYTFDGINEYGVTLSPMSNDGEQVYDPAKKSFHGLTTICLVLHSARNVHEAIAFLRRNNNSFSHEIHYLLTDALGNSVVIEYYDNDVVVNWRSGPFQICTNSRVSGFQFDATHWLYTCWRYSSLLSQLGNRQGVVSETDAFALLSSVAFDGASQGHTTNTIWSSVYNNITGRWQLTFNHQYETFYTFELPMITDIAIDDLVVLPKGMDLKFGKKLRINARIKNTGIRQSKATRIEFFLSKQNVINENSVLIRSLDVEAIGAGNSQSLHLSRKLTKNFIKRGAYYVIARLDAAVLNNDPTPADHLMVSSAKVKIRKK